MRVDYRRSKSFGVPLNCNAKHCTACSRPRETAGGKWVRARPTSLFVCRECLTTEHGQQTLEALRKGLRPPQPTDIRRKVEAA